MTRGAWRLQWGGIWKGRGYVKLIWRPDKPSLAYFRLRRRNPVDHKKARIGPVEVWW